MFQITAPGINSKGQIVGYYQGSDGNNRSCITPLLQRNAWSMGLPKVSNWAVDESPITSPCW
jgi:hypothetical protein